MTTKGNTPKRGDTPAETLADAMRVGRGYVGDLAQPLIFSVPTEEILHAAPEELNALEARLNSEIMAESRRRFDLLFAHYRLERGDFTGLAFALAFAHVPGLQIATPKRKRGRPTKYAKAIADLSKHSEPGYRNALYPLSFLMPGVKPKGKPGRPRGMSSAGCRELVAGADKWRAMRKAESGKAATDRAYCRFLCASYAETNHMSVREAEKRHLIPLVHQLSRARKLVAKP